MKGKINLFIVSLATFLLFSTNAFAANNFSIDAPSSVTMGKSFTVKVLYNGTDKAGSFQSQLTMVNASCSVTSTHSSGTNNCTGGVCHSAFASDSGIPSGTTLLTLSCTPQGSTTATFKVSMIGNDAWNVDGDVQIKISSASKSIKINGTTTKSTTTTTKSTAPPRTTTTRSNTIKPTTVKTTTRKPTTNSTTRKTVQNSTSNITKNTNTQTITSNVSSNTTLRIDLTDPTETTTEKEEESIKTVEVVPDNVKLNDLKIVGYDIKFIPNRLNYTIEVDKDVKELYIIADKNSDSIVVDNDGVVGIDGEKEVVIRVSSTVSSDEIEYTIKIKTKTYEGISFTVFLASLGIIILLLIILRIVQEIRKIKKNQSKDRKKKTILESKKNDSFPPIEKKADNYNIDESKNIDINKKDNNNSYEALLDELDNKPADKTVMPLSETFNQNELTDYEKQKIDDEDELWLTVETKTNNDNVLVEVSDVVPNTEEDVDKLFDNVDDYLEK